MKVISFYLPQFHEIPENNDAWGRGFTEWTNVRKAKPIYDWQILPRVPLNDNYYNLLDVDTIRWQQSLASDSGIYGFCIYHYWFNGRLVLEKPVKNLLNTRDINLNYCFCWANEPWTKTWHGAGGNKEILIPQVYGGVDEWKRHYEYFRPYFCDSRYIKEDNKPIVVIYRLRNIPDFNAMIKCWNNMAKQDGFDGLYIISLNVAREHVYMSKNVNACVDFEPNRSKYEIQSVGNGSSLVMDYDELYEEMLSRRHKINEFRCAFVDYDDTPRRGDRGVSVKGRSIEKFKNYFAKTLDLSKLEGNDYVFLNAWNEWGESNYLEPDTINGYGYLEAIKEILKEKV